MKGKQCFGMGVSSSKSRRITHRKGKHRAKPLKRKCVNKSWPLRKVGFRSASSSELLKTRGKNVMRKNIKKISKIALSAACKSVKVDGGKRKIRTARIIPIPKTGKILRVVPIFAGLSALGSLSGGEAGIILAKKAVKKVARIKSVPVCV